MHELSVVEWVALMSAAALMGFAKTAVGGVASLAVAIFAFVLPARESTGAVLVLLLVGDVAAIGLYRRHADWSVLLRLLPAVLPGVIVGAWFVARVDNVVMQRSIAVILASMVALQLWSRHQTRQAVMRATELSSSGVESLRDHGSRSGTLAALASTTRMTSPAAGLTPVAVGFVAGYSTMTANAAGPIMTLYLLLAGLPVLGLLGTGAWFFLLVNLAKVPFSVGLDLIDRQSLLMDLALVPALLVGAAIGAVVARRIPRRRFEDVTVVLTLSAAVALLA